MLFAHSYFNLFDVIEDYYIILKIIEETIFFIIINTLLTIIIVSFWGEKCIFNLFFNASHTMNGGIFERCYAKNVNYLHAQDYLNNKIYTRPHTQTY